MYKNIKDYHRSKKNLSYTYQRTGKSIYKVPPKHQRKYMNVNHDMIGYLAIYSHVPSPNIIIELRKERFLQKNSYCCESTCDFY